MSHLHCTCGYSISDITDNLPWKASFLPDEDTGHALDDVMTRVAQFIEARERGQEDEYLREQLGYVLPEHSLRDLLYNVFIHPTFEFGRTMYECDNCGRIWMQAVPDKNQWVSYMAESTARGVLRHEGAASDE